MKIEERPDPIPGPGEVRVRIAACGVCHTDLHYLDAGVPTYKKPPIILGHEAAGSVDRLGEGAEGVAVGQKVVVPAVLPCGQCAMCRVGRSNVCLRMKMLGNHVDGGFAQYVCLPARDAVPIPEGLDPVEVCLVADAVTTAYHAVVRRGEVHGGDRVAVFGCGGVGLSVVQFASVMGASVLAVDRDPAKLERARAVGAVEVLNVMEKKEPAKAIKQWSEGGVDRAFECIGKGETLLQAHASLRVGGRLCVVGFNEKPVEFPMGKVMFFEQEVVGSLGCRPVDFAPVLRMVKEGRFRIAPLITARRPLEEIGEAMEELRSGRAVRTVLIP